MAFDKNPSTIIAEIKLLNKSGSTSFILVEGPFDFKFLRTRKCSNVEIINCQGRRNLEEVSEINRARNLTKLIGVTDRDYDFFDLQPVLRNEDLVYTDFNDLETTILSFGVAEKIIQTLCDESKLNEDGIFLNCPSSIFRDSLFIGKLRYISKREQHNFPFQKKYPMPKYYDNTYTFNSDQLLNDFCAHTLLSQSEVLQQMSQVPEDPLWHMLRGHDCIFNIHNIIQKYKCIDSKPLSIDTCLLFALDTDQFKQCYVYSEIKNWERNNNCMILL